MNWVAISAMGELISAIVVVATLVYLAIQIKQSNSAMQSSNSTTVLINNQNLAEAIMHDLELGYTIIRVMSCEENLSKRFLRRTILHEW